MDEEIRVAKEQLLDALRIVEAIETAPETIDGLRESGGKPHLNDALASLGGCFYLIEKWWPHGIDRPQLKSQRSASF